MRHLFGAVVALILTSAVLTGPAAAQSTYRIQPGDVLDVTVLEDAALNRQVLVGPDGRISLPLAGTVNAGGQTIETVERNIAQRLASNFAVEPNVFVALQALAPNPARSRRT
jgi:polysaccharide export outer membrane protein